MNDERKAGAAGESAGGRKLATFLCVVLLLCFAALMTIELLLPNLDQKLEQAVRREFMLSEDAAVRIHRGSMMQTLRGYLSRFTVESASAVIDGLPVQALEFEARGIDFNMRGILRGDKAELTALDRADISISVAEEHLQQRLAPLIEEEGLLEPEISIEADGVKIVARKKNKLLGKVKIGAKGCFIADGSSRVRFELRDLELGQVNIGIAGLGLDFDEALPVLDMGGFAGDIMVDNVSTSPGLLHVKAHTGSGGIPTEIQGGI